MSVETVKIYSFKLHADTNGANEVQAFKGTRDAIAKCALSEVIEGTGEEIDVSLLDAEGFYRGSASWRR